MVCSSVSLNHSFLKEFDGDVQLIFLGFPKNKGNAFSSLSLLLPYQVMTSQLLAVQEMEVLGVNHSPS